MSCMILKRVFAHAVPVAKTANTLAVSERGSAICYTWLETELLELRRKVCAAVRKNPVVDEKYNCSVFVFVTKKGRQ